MVKGHGQTSRPPSYIRGDGSGFDRCHRVWGVTYLAGEASLRHGSEAVSASCQGPVDCQHRQSGYRVTFSSWILVSVVVTVSLGLAGLSQAFRGLAILVLTLFVLRLAYLRSHPYATDGTHQGLVGSDHGVAPTTDGPCLA
jgi:hypothetical protein